MAKPPVSITDDAYFQEQPETRTGLPVDPTSPMFYQMVAPFLPIEYETLRPYEARSSYIEDMGGFTAYREIPGEYKITGFGTPPIISGGIEAFKKFLEDPTGTTSSFATAVGEELKAYPERQLRTALSGGVSFNPETGEVERFDPFAIPTTVAVGTAKSIARTAGDDGTVLGIMGGRRSKTGSARENTAKSMQAMGKSPDEIFRSVGVFYDEDVLGKPLEAFRFEIPTGNSTLLPDATRTKDISYGSGEAFGLNEGFAKAYITSEGGAVNTGGKRATLQEVLDFPELYDEYPELRNVEVFSLQPTGDQNPFALPVAAYSKPHENNEGTHQILIRDFANPKDFQSALLHEVQHVVQYIESFPSGASAKDIFDILEERYPDADPKTLERLALQSYATVYGEAEARNVQRRFENPEEALLNPVETRRKEVADREVAMDELDAADRVDEDAISEAAGIAPFGPLLGGGQESRLTVRDFNFYQDNPAVDRPETGKDWLESNIRYTEDRYSISDPSMLRGPTTAVLGQGRRYGQSEDAPVNDMFLSTDELSQLPGANFETRGPGDPQFDLLLEKVKAEGFDPDQAGNKVVVGVNHLGQAYILEGNTRAAVAKELGIPSLKTEVRYWNGGEMVNGPYNPYVVAARASTESRTTDQGIGPFGPLLGGDKPQRFYHGTGAAFKEFDPDAPYTFVADTPSSAEYFAGDVSDGAPNIRPVYLKDANFFDVDNPDHLRQLRESDFYQKNKEELDRFALDEDVDFIGAVEAGRYDSIEDSGVIDWMRSNGFDGFTTYEQDGKNYAVFDVENIVPGVAKKAETDQGIAPFGPLLGGGLQESRPTDTAPVTIRSLGGGRGGIYGLVHGSKSKFADKEYDVPSDLEGLVFDDPMRVGKPPLAAPVDKLVLDAGAVADIGERRTVLGSELIERFGFSNRIKDAITGQTAASAEGGRPGFSIGTDPVLSYTQFTGDNYGKDINRLYAVEPQKKGYKATGEFDPETGEPIYELKDITMQDVEDLSPAAYLVEAYNPEKPFSKKPNSEFMESEVHIHEDLSHGMKPRPLSPRERQDALATIEYEKRILNTANNARLDFTLQNNTRTIGDPNVDVFNLDKAFKQLNLAVNTPTPVGAMTQKQVDYTILDFADMLALPSGLDTTITRQRIIDNYGPAGENLIAALENYRKKRDITNNESLKNEVFNEASLLKKRLVNDSLTGDAKKFSDFLNVTRYSGLEIDIPERYQYKFLSLGNARRNNDTAELKRLTDELTSGDYPAWDAITFIDDDGFLSFKGMPGSRVKLAERGVDLSGNPKQMTVEDFDIPMSVRNKIRQLSNKFMGRVPRDRFLEEVNQSVPIGYVDLVMQLFDTRHDRLVKFADSINKEPVARQFNESFNQLRSARQGVADALRDVAAINPIRGTGNLPARVQPSKDLMGAGAALIDSKKSLFPGKRAELIEKAREAVRKANIGPRPGAKLYEEGGAVRGPRIKSGIAGFVPYMVQ